MTRTPPLILTFLLSAAWTLLQAADAPPRKFQAREFGAVGDGKTNDRAALQKALDAAADAGSGEVDLPPGRYLTGSLNLKSHVTLMLAKDAVIQGCSDPEQYPIEPARWEGNEVPCHRALIHADHAEDIAIAGEGTIEGDPNMIQWGAGNALRKNHQPRGPALVEPVECKNVRLSGLTLTSHAMWTLHPTFCQDVSITKVTILSDGPNSDGIDPDSCQRMKIDGCRFTSGDDDIAIKSGKGQEGVKVGRPCEDIDISNCLFIQGHAGVALGSELSGGIARIHVSGCTFQNTSHAAIYVKSRPGRGGYVRGVKAEHLVVGPGLLFEILTDYKPNPDPQGVPGPEGITEIRDIEISDVQADSKILVRVGGSADKPVAGITLRDIGGKCAQGFDIRNATGVSIVGIHLEGRAEAKLEKDEAKEDAGKP